MIIKTKNKKFMPHAKLIAGLMAVALLPFILGWIVGSAQTMSWMIDFGLKFVDVGPILKKQDIQRALAAYKASNGEILYSSESPFFINNTNMTPYPPMCLAP